MRMASDIATCMNYTGLDLFTDQEIHIARRIARPPGENIARGSLGLASNYPAHPPFLEVPLG